ncbi:hypothetical protein FQN54_007072 [Arachnomyces sp. PD_36]|nr:hypothetical protein FQN54_007072 [Arachnomyces sp. PD_36]
MRTYAIIASLATAAAAQEMCAEYEAQEGGSYIVANNLWGMDAGTGSQCTSVQSIDDSGVSWSTTWNWSGGDDNVKSYSNSGAIITPTLISDIGKLSTSVEWTYDNEDIRANVAYDLFTAADANHVTSSGDYELMIWLARFGEIYPIGSSIGSVNVAGADWELYNGMNGDMEVFSFIAPSTTNSFSADVKEFFNYLADSQGFPIDSQHLLIFQFGTEPFTGEGTLTVPQFTATAQ